MQVAQRPCRGGEAVRDRVHYPGDTIVGAVIGASTSYGVDAVADSFAPAAGPLSYLHAPET